MDFHKAGILLEKINALYKNMSADSDSVSEIEKDLMRAYLRQFFDHFLPSDDADADNLPVEFTQPEPIRKPAKKVEILKAAPDDEDETPPPPPRKKEKPHEPEPEENDQPYEAPPVIQVPPPLQNEAADQPAPRPASPPQNEEEAEEELENLFEHHQAREISEKLSELPIQDLGKAMGLNEKIFTINELFDGDQEAFKNAIQVLNSLSTFEEAKHYLVREVALRYNWAFSDKKNKAKNFIKLVRRRYNP